MQKAGLFPMFPLAVGKNIRRRQKVTCFRNIVSEFVYRDLSIFCAVSYAPSIQILISEHSYSHFKSILAIVSLRLTGGNMPFPPAGR